MKKSLTLEEKVEKIYLLFFKISAAALIVFLIDAFVYFKYPINLFDKIGLYSLTLSPIGIIVFQFLTTSGLTYSKEHIAAYIFLYLIVFPIGTIWFSLGLNFTLEILPYRIADSPAIRAEFNRLFFLYAGILYLFINTIGILFRFGRKFMKRKYVVA